MKCIHKNDTDAVCTNWLQVTGVISDSSGKANWVIQGTWDDKIDGAKVLTTSESKGKTVFETGPTTLMWQRKYITYVTVVHRLAYQTGRKSRNHEKCMVILLYDSLL